MQNTYLDYNATTPLHPELTGYVQSQMLNFGNPSSVHWAGRQAKKTLSQSRETISKFLNIDPLEIIFTAGGSEANNLALKGIASRLPAGKTEIICSTVEHPSVMKTMSYLSERGFHIRWLDVSQDGLIDLKQLDNLLNEKTALVSVQLVNNEVGSIFPLKEISARAKKFGALVHSDMVQALGKIPIDLKDLGVDLASFAAHKFYSLKGAGLLYVKRGTHLDPVTHGGGQERSRRAGTENVLAIGTFAQAIRHLGPQIIEQTEKLRTLRDQLQTKILSEITGTSVNGLNENRVSNTLNISFENVDGETLLINLDTRGFAVSSGAACSSGSNEPSPVLRAMGFSVNRANQSLRISLGWLTTQDEIDQFFSNLVEALKQIRNSYKTNEFERVLA